MKAIHKYDQDGFSLPIILFVLLCLGAVGYTGWRVFSVTNRKQTNQLNVVGNKTENSKKAGVFTSDFLDTTFSYPEAWGTYKVENTPVDGPVRGEFYNVSFEKETEIDINFVTRGFSSPLDACGYIGDPVGFMKFSLSADRTSIIGWDAEKNLKVLFGQGQGDPDGDDYIKLVPLDPSEFSEGYEEVGAIKMVLIYKDRYNEKSMNKPEQLDEADPCPSTSQEEADKANEYFKFVKYAVNYSNDKIKGTNAMYDARKMFDTKKNEQLVEVLNSIKTLK